MFVPLDFSHQNDLKYEDLYGQIREYYPDADFTILRKAYDFSEEKHQGQKRASGEPYFIHPVNVAFILSKLKMDFRHNRFRFIT